ncbi:MAG: methylmalonyl Co-A mutase-associated GTPase MeaB [Candidatus Neomarinimicrobiota bacterium]
MTKNILKNLKKKDNRTISRCISLIENKEDSYLDLLSSIFPYTGNAYRIGITGAPGSGKSTLTDQLIKTMLDKNLSIAIIAIDPSSPFNGGAILGDRIRFVNDFKNKNTFFRSMSTRGSQGGLAASAKSVADIFDACEFDIIIFETVGVGQVEIDVIEAVDTVVVTLVPESGDDIQMMKGGLMEIADLFVINKSDRQGADRLYASLNRTLELNAHSPWNPNIIKTIATNATGVDLLYENILNHKEFLETSSFGSEKLNQRYIKTVKDYISEFLINEFWTENINDLINKQLDVDYSKRVSPYEMANLLLKK